MKFNQILIMATLIIGLSSCSIYKKNTNKETSTTETMQLKGNKWQLIEVDGKAVPAQVNGRVPHLQFEDNRYAANAGCNTLGGEVHITGKNKIKFGQGMSTMMACPDLDIEQSLSKAIIAVDSYTIAGDILSLNKGGKTLAKFTLIKSEKNKQALTGTWELDYITGPRIAFEGLYPNKKPTITFDTNTKKVSGNSSCNNYHGTFNTENNQISFGPLATTKMACEGSGENVYFSTLDKITSFDVNDNTLTLIMGDIAMMRFQKK